ncbi:MAG TPA: metal-dependent hydrolase [Bacteroidia bacterium]|nr:metal-dependent hydrolase [Bacteroidia bacterium]
MPSAFSHAIAAYAAGKIYPRTKTSFKFFLTGMICAAFPDIDAIGFWMGIPYHSIWGHRGITHSFFFAFALAFVVMQLFYANEKVRSRSYHLKWLYFFIATASHPVLDAMTSGGMGVAFFAPFENSRYFFPFRPILVSPISVSGFFSSRGLAVFKSEFTWIWIPCLILIGLSYFLRGKKGI